MKTNSQSEEYTLLDTIEAAPQFGCAPATLKQSRVSGVLHGKPAPQYIKLGKTVRYKSTTPKVWLAQFEEVTVSQS